MAGDPRTRAFDLVVVGTSWGGLQALGTLLEGLPARFGLPIVVAQHRAPDSSTILVRLLQARSSLIIREASDKDELQPGCVYIAPPDYHLLVERGTVALSTEEAVRYSRPSIDVMFESAADAYGERLVGVILTGANDDGALGLKRIRDGGGVAVVQDPATAERREMPEAAIATVASAKVLPLEEIASFMGQVCSAGMS
ncbi:MAG: chemotaxis protein CheB [Actinomycetota bacterium]|nr:chemotaxis protein CheB [Actinomycetota bacterium]